LRRMKGRAHRGLPLSVPLAPESLRDAPAELDPPAPSAAAAFRSTSVVRAPELWLLTALSAFLHFWRLFTPHAVVFDEYHYERFTGLYLTGQYMFYVHPPLGRLMYVALAKLLGVSSATLLAPAPAPVLRVLPAAFGTVLVPLIYILLRQLAASRRVATLGAIAILLDNALLLIARCILVDIFLIVYGVGAVSCFLAARRRGGAGRWAFLAASALLAGCALSVKWTGASGLGIVLAAWFVDWVPGLLRARRERGARRELGRFVGEGTLLVAVPAAIYLLSFAVHFALLTRTGPGDAMMNVRFLSQLPGSKLYKPDAPKLSYWGKLQVVHHAIRYGNGSLERATHPAASPWYTWPIMKHPIAFWESTTARLPAPRSMILLGNPVVWWAGLFGFFGAAAGLALRRRRFARWRYALLLLGGGVLLNFLPFAGIKRLMYLYHYLFALTLLVALAAVVGGIAAGWMDDADAAPWRFGSRRSAGVYVGVVALVLVSFLYFSPFTYGFTLSAAAYDARFWVLHPRF